MKATIALVPAFNEAARIGHTVRALQRMTSMIEVVVVDDGSTDCTSSEARREGACCLTLPRNVGKGDALNVGVGLIRQRIVDGILGVPSVLLLADGDLGDSAGELDRLVRELEITGADVAIATLPPQEGQRASDWPEGWRPPGSDTSPGAR
ncbi:MAG: glycosyltransferase [Actinomycetota bacterium]|nr:glycosyltransferase [Actinomycetota bacterium]